jgi:histidinol-phosphatase (PHP family)
MYFPGNVDFSVDFAEYGRRIDEIKDAYKGMKIRKGIEAGIDVRTVKKMEEALADIDLDFVIGSTHLVSGHDPYLSEFWQLYDKTTAFDEYIKACAQCIGSCGFFDVFGHIGYISKFCPYEDARLKYGDYKDGIDAILKALIEKGKGIEVNTSGIERTGATLPDEQILRRYFELGGEMITVGSDAHSEAAVGRAVNETLEMLKRIGFRYVCAFEKREPRFLRI